jgi:hypothetical protein
MLHMGCFAKHLFVFLLFGEILVWHYPFPLFIWRLSFHFHFWYVILVLYLLGFWRINTYFLKFFQSFFSLFPYLSLSLLLLLNSFILLGWTLFNLLSLFIGSYSAFSICFDDWVWRLALFEFFICQVLAF